MARRILVYISKSEPTNPALVVVAPPLDARVQADATLGLANWREFDVTTGMVMALDELVQLARERDATRDGTGRWRWRAVANVVKRWLSESVDETCAQCGQQWPSS